MAGPLRIAIDKVEAVEQMYLLFTPNVLTPAKLAEYKANAEAFARAGKLQRFDPKAWARSGSRAQPHSLQPALIEQHVPEWLLYQQCADAANSALGQAMARQLFPALSAAYAGVPPPAPGQPMPGRLGVLLDKLKQQQGAAFVLHDPIGLTQELNDFRNAAVDQLRPWLQAHDAKTGVTNERRVHVLGALDDVRSALQAGIVSRQQEAIEQHRQMSDANLQRRLDQAKTLRLQGRTAEATAIETDVERSRQVREVNYQRAVADARTEAPQAWNPYAKRLPGMEPFRQQFHNMLAQHEAKLLARVDDHLRWLQSAQLLAALHAYDRSNVASGQHMQAQAGLALLGMNYTEAGMKLVLQWAQQQAIKPDNLLLRAYCLNQEDIERALEQSMKSARSAAQATGADWWTALDNVQGGMKNAIEAFDKANVALESMPESHGFRGSMIGTSAVVYSTWGRRCSSSGCRGRTRGSGGCTSASWRPAWAASTAGCACQSWRMRIRRSPKLRHSAARGRPRAGSARRSRPKSPRGAGATSTRSARPA